MTGSDPFTYVFCEKQKKVKILGEEHVARNFINNDNLSIGIICQKYKLVFESEYEKYWVIIDPCKTLSTEFKNLIEELFD